MSVRAWPAGGAPSGRCLPPPVVTRQTDDLPGDIRRFSPIRRDLIISEPIVRFPLRQEGLDPLGRVGGAGDQRTHLALLAPPRGDRRRALEIYKEAPGPGVL